jgi:hypothetical protein
VLDVIPEDPCCGKRLAKALAAGYEGDLWECQKCSCSWKARIVYGVREWDFQGYVEVFR